MKQRLLFLRNLSLLLATSVIATSCAPPEGYWGASTFLNSQSSYYSTLSPAEIHRRNIKQLFWNRAFLACRDQLQENDEPDLYRYGAWATLFLYSPERGGKTPLENEYMNVQALKEARRMFRKLKKSKWRVEAQILERLTNNYASCPRCFDAFIREMSTLQRPAALAYLEYRYPKWFSRFKLKELTAYNW